MDYDVDLRAARKVFEEWEARPRIVQLGLTGWYRYYPAPVNGTCSCGKKAVRRGKCEKCRLLHKPPCTRCEKHPQAAKGLCRGCYITVRRQADPMYGRGAMLRRRRPRARAVSRRTKAVA